MSVKWEFELKTKFIDLNLSDKITNDNWLN